MNGDSQKNLLNEAIAAMDALRTAEDALFGITVNGRNFYPQGDTAIYEAQDAFTEMMKRFAVIKAEVEEYAIAISNGGFKQ